MARRLPRPADPARPRCEIDAAELAAVEEAAHACRLSVSAYIRVALVETAGRIPERLAAWQEIAARIAAEAPADAPKPGRPKKQ